MRIPVDEAAVAAQFWPTVPSLSHLSPRLLALASWIAWSLALPASAARKDEKKVPLPTPPPQAVEQKVEVPRGKAVNIPLKIYGTQRELLRFLIRSEPEHGELTEPEALGRESAMVTYSPPADYEVTQDEFTYAVKNSAGVSAAATVTIQIVDEAAVLAIPRTLKYEPLLAGKRASQDFEIKNSGGGVAQGTMRVDEPWEIDGETEYRLPAGSSRLVTLHFAPKTAGEFRTEIRFSSHPQHTTAVRGEAQPQILVEPATLVLVQKPGEPARSLIATLINNTATPQAVGLKAPEGLTVTPERLLIPENGSTSFEVKTAEGNVSAVNGNLQVGTDEVSFDVPVTAGRAKAVLLASVPELRLESPAMGARPLGKLSVKNAGGEEGFWKWELLAPFMTLETEARLAPGGSVEIPIQLEAQTSGSYRTVLKIIGEQQTVEIPITGDAVVASPRSAASRPATSKPRSQARRPEVGLVRTSTSRAAGDESEPQERTYAYKTIGVQKREPDRLVLVWLAEQYPAEAYQVEMRKMSLGPDRELKIDWTPVPGQKVERYQGRGVRAELTGLDPGQLYVLRLTVAQAGSQERLEVGGIEVATPAKPPLVKVTPLRGLFVLLFVVVGVTIWLKRRASRA